MHRLIWRETREWWKLLKIILLLSFGRWAMKPETVLTLKLLKVKSGRLQWRFSKRYEKLRSELAEMLRLCAATRKREHGEVCNWLLGHAGQDVYKRQVGHSDPVALYGRAIAQRIKGTLGITG